MTDVEKFVRELLLDGETDLARKILELFPNQAHLFVELFLFESNIEKAKEVYKTLSGEKRDFYSQFLVPGGEELLRNFLRIQTRVRSNKFKIPKELTLKIVEILNNELNNTYDESRKNYLLGLLKRLHNKNRRKVEIKQYIFIISGLSLIFILGYISFVMNIAFKTREEVSRLQDDFTFVKSSVNSALKKVTEMEKIVQTSMEQVSIFEERMNGLSTDSEKFYKEFEQFKNNIFKQLNYLNAKNNEFLESLNQIKQNISNNNLKKIADLERRLNTLNSSLSELRTKISSIEKSYQSSFENITKITGQLQKELNDLKTTVSNSIANEKNVEVSSNLSAIENMITNNMTQIEYLKEYISSIKNLQTDVQQLKEIYSNLESKYNELNIKIDNISTTQQQKDKEETSEIQTSTVESSKDAKKVEVKEETTNIKHEADQTVESSKTNIIITKDNIRQLWLAALDFYVSEDYQKSAEILSEIEKSIDETDVYFKEEIYYFLVDSYIRTKDTKSAELYYEKYKGKYPSGKYIYSIEKLLGK